MSLAFQKMLALLVCNAAFAAVILGLLLVLARTKPATFAVVKRNFVGYFSNPTGYVFICVFMFLCSVAAFWPRTFFDENLATLYQLNSWFAPVMLIFIPAITMSIWSEERREGTDELLLTMPASDIDIVIGKYLAAALIYTVALGFSQIVTFRVLNNLSQGDLDLGLFLSTYLGYWLLGLAMIAVGMTASFFTSNLTVGYVLGGLFNAPLVFLTFANRLLPRGDFAQALANWSYSARFRDFGRGVVSLSSTAFFVALIALGIYVSLVLIGRRHWVGGRDGESRLGHYIVRGLSLVAIGAGLTSYFTNHDWIRRDLTSGKVSSLAPETKEILKRIPKDKPVMIEAFVGDSIPEAFVETRVDLINKLREFDGAAGSHVQVRIHDGLEPFTEEATRAEEQYGIKPERVFGRAGGRLEENELILGAAIVSGLERVVIPFFGRGIPVEYELIRSIKTATGAERPHLGVVETDAKMMGGLDMATFQSRPKERIVQELEKQYEVERVDANSPIDPERFDVLLVVQPSSLSPPQMENLVAAVRDGIPTAIFEDPFPLALGHVPGTGEPRRPAGNPMFGGGPPPEPKADLTRLWRVLGIEMVGEPNPMAQGYDAQVVFQDYNPYRKVDVSEITKEWVFVSPEAPAADREALNVADPVTSGLREVLCIFPGGLRNLQAKGLEFTPLLKTGEESGFITAEDARMNMGNVREMERAERFTRKKYVLGARIRGFLKEPLSMSDAGSPLLAQAAVPEPPDAPSDEDASAENKVEGTSDPENSSANKTRDERQKEIHVVYVCDIDLLSSDFLRIREEPDDELNWRFDNVTFALNVVDSLVGESELVEIRKRWPRHSTLKQLDDRTEGARTQSQDQIRTKSDEFKAQVEEEEAKIQKGYSDLTKKVEELKKRAESGDRSAYAELQSEVTRLGVQEQIAAKKKQVLKDKAEQDLRRELTRIQHGLERTIEKEQMKYKWSATWPSLVVPLIVGLGVWIVRNQREREGVADERRR